MNSLPAIAKEATMGQALIIVDVQNDFCEGGALAVTGGAQVAAQVSEFMENHHAEFDVIALTQDWHIDPGSHFSTEPDFDRSWPVHCVAGTPGAELHPDLDTEHITARFLKGLYDDGYSGFEGRSGEPERVGILEGEKGIKVEPEDVIASEAPDLDTWLRQHEIESVTLVGIATDHCVRATALDAAENDYEVTVLTDLVAGVSEETVAQALDEFREAGITLTTSEDW